MPESQWTPLIRMAGSRRQTRRPAGPVRHAVNACDPLLLTGVRWFLLAGNQVGRWHRRHKETRA
jgi:hypothetical protein